MKYKGEKVYNPNKEIVVIPRPDGEDFVFVAKALLDMDEFDTLCSPPTPPSVITKGGERQFDFKNHDFLQQSQVHAKKRMDYMVIQSLKETKELEWEKVKFSDPNTWHYWREELKEAGFNHYEIQRIENTVYTANSLNERKIEEARANFLRRQEATQNESTGKQDTQNSSQSGELAKDSESSRQT